MPDWVFTAAWIAMGVWFLVWEFLAIKRRPAGDTLSEHVWDWFKLKGPKGKLTGWQAVRRVAFITRSG